MQSIIALCSLLAIAVSAGPIDARSYPEVTFALSNDQSGANAGATFLADGTDKYFSGLFAGTSVDASGQVVASSGQLTAFPQSVNCVLKNNWAYVTTLTAQNTYIDLDGNPSASIPVNVNGGTINCHA